MRKTAAVLALSLMLGTVIIGVGATPASAGTQIYGKNCEVIGAGSNSFRLCAFGEVWSNLAGTWWQGTANWCYDHCADASRIQINFVKTWRTFDGVNYQLYDQSCTNTDPCTFNPMQDGQDMSTSRSGCCPNGTFHTHVRYRVYWKDCTCWSSYHQLNSHDYQF